LVIWFEPSATGSGIPEVIGYLNGVHLPNIFTPKVYVAKVISVICSVASGLPLGPEGPMIHIGGAVGAAVEYNNPLFRKIVPWYHFKNQEDKRHFVLGGVAAGVAAAFNAPIGGLAFAWEEISTFWDGKTSWMILFACMVAAYSTNLLLSIAAAPAEAGSFNRNTILFYVPSVSSLGVLIFIPAIIIGLVGGILAVIFTWIALGLGKFRKRYLQNRVLKLVDTCLLVIVFMTIGFYFPYAFPCHELPSTSRVNPEYSQLIFNDSDNELLLPSKWICPDGTYNDMALLSFSSGHNIIRILLQHDNVNLFSYSTLFAFLIYYFLFAAWSAGGIAVACGFVVPMLTVGALYGRIFGKVMIEILALNDYNTPGMYSLLGAAAFFAGVTRLSVSLTIIMIELSGDVLLAFPLMVSIMVAKNVADYIVHPLYHEQLALKGVPYLDQPSNLHGLESLTVSNVMTDNVVVLQEVENIGTLKSVMERYDFSSFPVVGEGLIYKGIIHRNELNILLSCKDLFIKNKIDLTTKIMSWREYKSLLDDGDAKKILPDLSPEELENYIDLVPYINTGMYSVPTEFLLKDAYELFRTLGLTHLMVINKKNELVGVITRKDLLGENIALKREKKKVKIRSRIKGMINSIKDREGSSRNFSLN